jgi:glycosyltransferase involved in cell wall biosynthesis
MTQDIAIAHEKLLGYGGAQQVAFEFARTFDAPIYTGWKDDDYVRDDVEVHQIFSERSKHLLKGPVALADAYHMLKWQWVEELYDYDTVIINKPACSWFVPRPDQTIIYYAHHPPRVIYDRWYRQKKPSMLKRLVNTAKRVIYKHPFDYPDKIIANSETTEYRFRRYLDIDVDEIVHPPIRTQQFAPDAAETDGYLLSLGSLEPRKRLGEVIEAIERTDEELFVAGDGTERNQLESRANGQVRFLGDVSEAEKPELLAGAKAFVFNAEAEDFGMSPIEAMASGTPVIGVDEGFTQEQVADGFNGVLYERGELVDAIERATSMQWDESALLDYAERYSVDRFRERMREVIDG